MRNLDLIEAHLAWCRARGLSPNTIHIRDVVLRKADREIPGGLLAPGQAITKWLDGTSRRGPWSRNTKSVYRAHLAALFDWALFTDELDWSPMVHVGKVKKPPRVPNPWSTDQFTEIVQRAKQPWRLAAVLAGGNGLRCCEVVALEPGDVTELHMRVHGKGGTVDVVDTHPLVWRELSHFPGTAPYIVQAGGKQDAKWLSRSASEHFHRLGIPVTLHMGRHWHGDEHLAAQGNLRSTQAALRHRSITSTVPYTMIRDEGRRIGTLALPVPDGATR